MAEDTVSQDAGSAADAGTADTGGNVLQFPTPDSAVLEAIDSARAAAASLSTVLIIAVDKDDHWRTVIQAHTTLNDVQMARAMLEVATRRIMGG